MWNPFVEVPTVLSFHSRVTLSQYFAGGINFHGRYEFVPIQNMEKAMKSNR